MKPAEEPNVQTLVDPIEADRVLKVLGDLLDEIQDEALSDILGDAYAEIALLVDPNGELEAEAA